MLQIVGDWSDHYQLWSSSFRWSFWSSMTLWSLSSLWSMASPWSFVIRMLFDYEPRIMKHRPPEKKHFFFRYSEYHDVEHSRFAKVLLLGKNWPKSRLAIKTALNSSVSWTELGMTSDGRVACKVARFVMAVVWYFSVNVEIAVKSFMTRWHGRFRATPNVSKSPVCKSLFRFISSPHVPMRPNMVE
jgi:hypothetical protein